MDKAQELREKLRHARQRQTTADITDGTTDNPATSIPGTDYEPDTTNGNGALNITRGPITGRDSRIKDTSERTARIEGRTANGTRGTAQSNFGDGSDSRRSGIDHSQSRTDGANVSTGTRKRTRRVGNLETEEAITPRTLQPDTTTDTTPEILKHWFTGGEQEKGILSHTPTPDTTSRATPNKDKQTNTQRDKEPTKRGRKPKQVVKDIGSKIESKVKEAVTKLQEPAPETHKTTPSIPGKTITRQEASILEEPLVEALQRELELLDRGLLQLTKDVNTLEQAVWSDMSDQSVAILAQQIIKLGQRSPVAATFVRTAIDLDSYVATAMLIGPRFMKSVILLQQAYQLKKQSRGEKNENRTRRGILQHLRRDVE